MCVLLAIEVVLYGVGVVAVVLSLSGVLSLFMVLPGVVMLLLGLMMRVVRLELGLRRRRDPTRELVSWLDRRVADSERMVEGGEDDGLSAD